MLAHRQSSKTQSERLAEAARQVDPTAFYYEVFQGDAQVGVASSAIDTTHGQLRSVDMFRGRLVVFGDTQSVEANATAYLSQRLSVDSFALEVGGDQRPMRLRGAPNAGGGPLFLPTQLPIALMLTGPAKVGRADSFWVYNPIARDVQRTTLRIRAESLFTVSDSAKYDSTTARWVSAHADTIRSWSVTSGASELTVWVDAQGRIVSASEPGGLRLQRTAYEQAFSNWRNRHENKHP